MITAVQRVIVQGTSLMIVLPRKLAIPCRIEPGDFLEIAIDEETTTGTIRRWGSAVIGKSPGVLTPPPPEPPKRP